MRAHETYRTAPTERECFADEVAIDFLALGAVVERMRAAFFSADDEPSSRDPRALRPSRGFGGRPDS